MCRLGWSLSDNETGWESSSHHSKSQRIWTAGISRLGISFSSFFIVCAFCSMHDMSLFLFHFHYAFYLWIHCQIRWTVVKVMWCLMHIESCVCNWCHQEWHPDIIAAVLMKMSPQWLDMSEQPNRRSADIKMHFLVFTGVTWLTASQLYAVSQ